MDFGGNGTWIEWNDVAAPAAGTYTLRIVYANGGSNPRAASVIVNGQSVGTRSFASTTSCFEAKHRFKRMLLESSMHMRQQTPTDGISFSSVGDL